MKGREKKNLFFLREKKNSRNEITNASTCFVSCSTKKKNRKKWNLCDESIENRKKIKQEVKQKKKIQYIFFFFRNKKNLSSKMSKILPLFLSICIVFFAAALLACCSASSDASSSSSSSSQLLRHTSHKNNDNNNKLHGKGGNCGIVAAPCDDTWSSRYNQTFAFEAAGPFVQIKAYWATYDACLGHNNGNASAVDPALPFYYTTCRQRQRKFVVVWTELTHDLRLLQQHSEPVPHPRRAHRSTTSPPPSSSVSAWRTAASTPSRNRASRRRVRAKR